MLELFLGVGAKRRNHPRGVTAKVLRHIEARPQRKRGVAPLERGFGNVFCERSGSTRPSALWFDFAHHPEQVSEANASKDSVIKHGN